MSDPAYFTAQEVLQQVEGLHSLSTLNQWANFIQKECAYTFHYEALPFQTWSRQGRCVYHRNTRLYSQEEISCFKQAVTLIPKLGRAKALRQLFDTRTSIDQMKPHELAEWLNQQLLQEHTTWKDTFKAVMQKQLELQQEVQSLSRALQLVQEQQAALEGNLSGGWFRRKR